MQDSSQSEDDDDTEGELRDDRNIEKSSIESVGEVILLVQGVEFVICVCDKVQLSENRGMVE